MLKSAADILGSYAGRGVDLAPWLADAAINRERHLRLQYLAGLAANTDQRFAIFQGDSRLPKISGGPVRSARRHRNALAVLV